MKMLMLSTKKTLLFALMLILLVNQSTSKHWCWTKSMQNEPSWQFDEEKGGVNWGFCKMEESEPTKMKYEVTVVTSGIQKSETT
jgi:hypothetical protein